MPVDGVFTPEIPSEPKWTNDRAGAVGEVFHQAGEGIVYKQI